MAYVGGQRQRLIFDSFYRMLHDVLEARGWFDSVDGRAQVSMTFEPVALQEAIAFNTIAVSDEDLTDNEAELGSNFGEIRWTFYVDFFAENRVVGRDLIGDVRDILKGRMESLGRTGPMLPVYDWTQATPTVIFYCEIEDVVVDRAHDYPQPWLSNWYSCRCDLVDYYTSESG